MIWFNLTMTRMTDMNIHLTVSIQIVGKGNFEGRISVGGALNMNMCKDANGLRMSNNPPVIQNCACWKITHTVRGFPQHCDGTSEGMLSMKSPVIPLNFFPSHYTHPIQSYIHPIFHVYLGFTWDLVGFQSLWKRHFWKGDDSSQESHEVLSNPLQSHRNPIGISFQPQILDVSENGLKPSIGYYFQTYLDVSQIPFQSHIWWKPPKK